MSDRCEKCEQVAAELRAEFNRRIDEVFDRISAALANVEARNRGVFADVEGRMQRLFDRFSERLLLSQQRMDEEPPRSH